MLVGHAEVREQQQEDEQVVERERALDQVDREVLDGVVAAPDRPDHEHRKEAEHEPADRPDRALAEARLAPAGEQPEVGPQERDHRHAENRPGDVRGAAMWGLELGGPPKARSSRRSTLGGLYAGDLKGAVDLTEDASFDCLFAHTRAAGTGTSRTARARAGSGQAPPTEQSRRRHASPGSRDAAGRPRGGPDTNPAPSVSPRRALARDVLAAMRGYLTCERCDWCLAVLHAVLGCAPAPVLPGMWPPRQPAFDRNPTAESRGLAHWRAVADDGSSPRTPRPARDSSRQRRGRPPARRRLVVYFRS